MSDTASIVLEWILIISLSALVFAMIMVVGALVTLMIKLITLIWKD